MKPVINDITTSFDSPPEFVELKKLNPDRDYTYPLDFETKQRGYYTLAPLEVVLSPDEVFNKIEDVAKKQAGWKIISADKNRRSIEITAATRIFRFRDDVVIEVRQNADKQTQIHMRSKSRLGKGDMGANYRRIQIFFERIRAALPKAVNQ